MITRKFSKAYPITPSATPLPAGTIGIWFSTAGVATVVLMDDSVVSVGGAVGSRFDDMPIKSVTASTATVLGLLGS
jgi:hypothetical protein